MKDSDYNYESVFEGAKTIADELGVSIEDAIPKIIQEDLPTSIENITNDMLECTDRDEMNYLIDEMIRFQVISQHYHKFAYDYFIKIGLI